jgi:hypothetical protein
MSNQTSPALNSYGVALPEPTDRMIEAVNGRDSGLTNQQIGDTLGVKAGAAGNYVTDGLRRMGREQEIGAKSSGTGTPKKATPKRPVIQSRADAIRAAIIDGYVSAKQELDALTGAVAHAEAEAEHFDPVAWIGNRDRELQAVIEEAENALRAFLAEAESHAEAEAERLVSHAENVRDSNAEAIANAEAVVEEYVTDDDLGIIAAYIAEAEAEQPEPTDQPTEAEPTAPKRNRK